MKKSLLYWIDDSNDPTAYVPKNAGRKHLESQLQVKLEVPPIKEHADFGKLVAGMTAESTFGVLMDYQLTKVGEGGGSEFGTVWAAQLRAANPSIPVVGLSSKPEKDIPRFQMENFLAFFERKVLLGAKPPVGELSALFKGYRTIWEKWKAQEDLPGLDIMMSLLRAPAAATELLRVAIPAELRGKWDNETPHAATRWIWHQLQGVPGFLFDELEAATYLGLTLEAFRRPRIVKHFVAARYEGALACGDRPRWWVCEMRDPVEKVVKQHLVGPVAESREELLGALRVPAKDRPLMMAVPHGRKKCDLPPECVTFRDQNSKNEGDLGARVPALLRDTVVDEIDANPPFGFQARRHFTPHVDV